MIKGVIFDLDGVLVSTDELHFKAWKMLAEELGITNFTKDDNARQKGVGRMASLEVVLEKAEDTYSYQEKLELADRKNNYFIKLLENLTDRDVLPGVIETLSLLRKMGLRIGIGSASKNTPLILKETGLESYFDEVSCGLDITRSKPDPEVFLIAAKKLELSPKECLVVEDSNAGVVAAKAADMKTLGVGTEYKKLGTDYEALTLQNEIDWSAIVCNAL